MERLTAPSVAVKSSGDRRHLVWQVVSGAPALTHARRGYDLKLNPKGIVLRSRNARSWPQGQLAGTNAGPTRVLGMASVALAIIRTGYSSAASS